MTLPPLDPDFSPDAAAVLRVARLVAARGGRALVVGGAVRDRLLEQEGKARPSKDLDVEVFGLSLDALAEILATEGTVDEVGRSFAVLMVHGLEVDFSVPRRDRKQGTGHRGFAVEPDPTLSVAEAARRRDFTINSISMDPLTGELIDPVGGVADLRMGVLRPTDHATFGEDPLRVLRAVQFAARFDLRASADLAAVMAAQDLAELAAERVREELRKLLLLGTRPSRGLDLLLESGCLTFFPYLGPPTRLGAAGLALDEWVERRPADPDVAFVEGLVLLGGDGLDPLLDRLGSLVRAGKAARALAATPLPVGDGAIRRTARVLKEAGTSLRSLASIASDRRAARVLLARAEELGVADAPIPVAVLGRHLIARGRSPGPEFKPIIARCLDLQDASGERDPEVLLDHVLETG